MKRENYVPNPWDNTTNAGVLVPPMVWMMLMCKQPDPKAITTGRDRLVVYMPVVPYSTRYESDKYVFTPLTQPIPQWQILRDFIPGSYVLQAFDKDPTFIQEAQSLFMWDIGGQDEFRAGDPISAGECSVMR